MTVAAERNALAKVSGRPTLRRREQWGSTFPYTGRWTVTHPATRIFIHISVTNPRNYGNYDAHARGIEAIGRSRFPNTGTSYQRLFMAGSTVVREGQPMFRQGAHTVNNFGISSCTRSGTGCPGRNQPLTAPSGNLNVNGRAYVICQNVNDPVPDAMLDLMARQIVADYRAGLITYHACHHPHGHRCVSSKSCPGPIMWGRMARLHTLIHHYLSNGFGSGGTSPTQPKPQPKPQPKEDALMAIQGTEQQVLDKIARTVWRYLLADPSGGADKFAQTYLRFAWRGSAEAWRTLPKLEELMKASLAAQEGVDETVILERMDQHHEEMKALATAAEERWGERLQELEDLSSSLSAGGLSPDDAFRKLGEILHGHYEEDVLEGEVVEPSELER